MSEFLANPVLWNTLASIATVVGAVIVIYAVRVALHQLKEMTKARHLEAMLQIYEMLDSKASRKARRFIYTELKSLPEQLTSDERETVEQVTTIFERLGVLVESDLIPKDVLFEGHCAVIIRSWNTLAPFIEHHRELKGKKYANHFQTLAKLAQEYHSKHWPDDNLEIVRVYTNTSQAAPNNLFNPTAR